MPCTQRHGLPTASQAESCASQRSTISFSTTEVCPPRLRRCESSTGFPARRSPRCQLSASQFPEQTPPWARRSAPPLLSPLQTPPCCQNSPGEQAALPPDSVPCHDQRRFQLKLLAPGRSGTAAFPKPPPEHLKQPEASILTRSTTGNVTAFFFFTAVV